MKHKKRFKIGFLILCLTACLTFPLTAHAHSEPTNGGEVSTNGKIIFYEETQSSESSTSDNSNSLTNTGGKLPKTGEIVRDFSLIGGIVLLVILLIVFYRKRKREGNHEN